MWSPLALIGRLQVERSKPQLRARPGSLFQRPLSMFRKIMDMEIKRLMFSSMPFFQSSRLSRSDSPLGAAGFLTSRPLWRSTASFFTLLCRYCYFVLSPLRRLHAMSGHSY